MNEKKMIKAVSVYVVRCKPHNVIKEDEFLKGIISVGWPCIGDLTGMSKKEIEPIFNAAWVGQGPIRLTQLYNFITMPVGSIVITPSVYNRDVHLFVTTSGYYYNKDQDIANNHVVGTSKGNPHQIRAKFIITVPREAFSTKLQESLNAAKRTVTNFSSYIPEIEAIINNEPLKSMESPNIYRDEAIETLAKLLKSEDENIRLQAAINLLKAKE
ncbi:MAG: hypothetical protein KKD38_10110 [Candidatus Delongbacteria bacterium]|nr:hypothetical protein [Candidatus Delongbacteria bacterium]